MSSELATSAGKMQEFSHFTLEGQISSPLNDKNNSHSERERVRPLPLSRRTCQKHTETPHCRRRANVPWWVWATHPIHFVSCFCSQKTIPLQNHLGLRGQQPPLQVRYLNARVLGLWKWGRDCYYPQPIFYGGKRLANKEQDPAKSKATASMET